MAGRSVCIFSLLLAGCAVPKPVVPTPVPPISSQQLVDAYTCGVIDGSMKVVRSLGSDTLTKELFDLAAAAPCDAIHALVGTTEAP